MNAKVYAYNDGMARLLVTADSPSQAAEIFGVALHLFDMCGAQTFSADEISMALRMPGKVCIRPFASFVWQIGVDAADVDRRTKRQKKHDATMDRLTRSAIRHMQALKARDDGMLVKDIAADLGVSGTQASQMTWKGARLLRYAAAGRDEFGIYKAAARDVFGEGWQDVAKRYSGEDGRLK